MNIMENVSTDELLELINEVAEMDKAARWDKERFPKVYAFYEKGEFTNIDTMIESYIIHEAKNRFGKIVPVLFKRYASEYLK